MINKFIRAHQLSATFREVANDFYYPLAGQIAARVTRGDLQLLGVSGAQGTGKSTFVDFTAQVLSCDYGLSVVNLSLDDFYLTRAERALLAGQVHPLLATRGVPGTHDVRLVRNLISQLFTGKTTLIPRFDKYSDDRVPIDRFDLSEGKVDLVILEGWCVGARAQPEESLLEPVNELERQEDGDGVWRAYVNEVLSTQYAELFSQINYLVVLQAPDFDSVYGWRREQEQKLSAKSGGKSALVNEPALRRFIMHYERITRTCLEELPAIADVVIKLNHTHGVDTIN